MPYLPSQSAWRLVGRATRPGSIGVDRRDRCRRRSRQSHSGVIVLSHLSFGVADLANAAAFYDGALGALGYVRVWSNEDGVGYGATGGNDKLALFPQAGRASPPGAGFHLAFAAPSCAAVDAFHA